MSCTIYVRNLNEKIGVNKIKRALRSQFEKHGHILDIVAKSNIRAKGQAFIVFDNAEEAQNAQEHMTNVELFGKPMHVQLARTVSDATILKNEGQETLDVQRKEPRKRLFEEMMEKSKDKQRSDTKEKKARGTRVEEQQPPHNILFVENLPPSTTEGSLDEIFGKFDGFIETRYFAVRHLAFIEFSTIPEATNAKSATHNLRLEGQLVKITYAKQ